MFCRRSRAAEEMRSVEEHRAAVRALIAPALGRVAEREPLLLPIDDPELVGRLTAVDLLSSFPMPPFTNSQMDGYAVLASDVLDASQEQPVELPIGWATAAGDPPLRHRPGTASPIMTGAAVPEGADAVIPVEAALPPRFPTLARHPFSLVRAEEANREPEGTVAFSEPVQPGAFVRHCGEDSPAGSALALRGRRLTPALIGALAAAGITEVPVQRRPRILVCATGDELQERSGALSPGRIYDANTPMLAAMLRSAGAETVRARSVDRPDELRRLLEGAESFDLAVTSGGISAGAYEVVREALEPLDAEFVSVAMQPGGPQGLANVERAASLPLPLLCFPGNPVSSMLSTEVFLLPELREAAGLPAERERQQLALAHDVTSPESKLQFRRGTVGADGTVTVSAPGSHLLTGLADADVIVEIPVGVEHVAAGRLLDTWRIA